MICKCILNERENLLTDANIFCGASPSFVCCIFWQNFQFCVVHAFGSFAFCVVHNFGTVFEMQKFRVLYFFPSNRAIHVAARNELKLRFSLARPNQKSSRCNFIKFKELQLKYFGENQWCCSTTHIKQFSLSSQQYHWIMKSSLF